MQKNTKSCSRKDQVHSVLGPTVPKKRPRQVQGARYLPSYLMIRLDGSQGPPPQLRRHISEQRRKTTVVE